MLFYAKPFQSHLISRQLPLHISICTLNSLIHWRHSFYFPRLPFELTPIKLSISLIRLPFNLHYQQLQHITNERHFTSTHFPRPFAEHSHFTRKLTDGIFTNKTMIDWLLNGVSTTFDSDTYWAVDKWNLQTESTNRWLEAERTRWQLTGGNFETCI